MGDIKNVKLKDFKVYKEEFGSLCLALTYEYEAKDGIHEFHIPKLALRISDKDIPSIETSHYMRHDDEVYADVGFHKYRLFKTEFDVPDKFGESHTINGCVADCLVKEIPKEITLEEIEKRLGYKVKIVSEKGDKK